MQTTLPYYAAFQASLDEFRRCLRADPFDLENLKRADQLVHNGYNLVRSLPHRDVADKAWFINNACEAITKNLNQDLDSQEKRLAAWTSVGEKRLDLDDAIASAMNPRN
ncbi:hypothetical protein ACWCP6_02845 [Streptomyces sp. NPDC002004]